MAHLNDTAYQVADQYRDGHWPEIKGRKWPSTWTFLVGELKQRCPGFSEQEYDKALNQGFTDSR